MKLAKLILTFVAFSLVSQVNAAIVYWTNPGEGDWNDAANWSNGVLFAEADDARINNGGTALITSLQNVTNNLVHVADTNGTTGTIRMTGGNLTTVSDIRVGGTSATVAAGTGRFDLSGGNILIRSGNVNVGIGPNAVSSTLNISGGTLQLNSSAAIVALGNRGSGTVNQTGGTFFLRAVNGLTQMGRNVTNSTASGTYNLSGGSLVTTRLIFGNAVGPVGSTNTFSLSGTGVVIANVLTNINTAAVNTFNFTGGTLTVQTNSISLVNNGGILSPASPNFGSLTNTSLQTVPVDPIGRMRFTGTSSYTQGATGTLAIDVREVKPADPVGTLGNDIVDIGASATNLASATIAGTIQVNFLDYSPSIGTEFDVLTADLISFNGTVVGSGGAILSSNIVTGTDGREVLRLTLTAQPIIPIRLTNPQVLGNGSFKFSFTNAASKTFSVYATSNITQPFASWTALGAATEVSPGQYEFTDPGATGGTLRFYRVTAP